MIQEDMILPNPNPVVVQPQPNELRRERPAQSSPAVFKFSHEASPLRRVSFDDGDDDRGDDDETVPMDDDEVMDNAAVPSFANSDTAMVAEVTPTAITSSSNITTSTSGTASNSTAVPMLIDLTCYWYSSNTATKFFRPHANEPSAKEALQAMISILEEVSDESQVHKVVANYDMYRYLEDKDRPFLFTQVMYVKHALIFAMDAFGACTHFSFGRACEESVEYIKFRYNPQTQVKPVHVAHWFRAFKRTRAFPNPKAHLEPILDLFLAHPGLYARAVVHFNNDNGTRSSISLSGAADYFVNTILRLASKQRGYSSAEFPRRIMADHGLIDLHKAAFHEWMTSTSAEENTSSP